MSGRDSDHDAWPVEVLSSVILWTTGVLFVALDLVWPAVLWRGGASDDPYFQLWLLWWWAVTGSPLLVTFGLTAFARLIHGASRARRRWIRDAERDFNRASAPGAQEPPR
jgi:hypothetical protein